MMMMMSNCLMISNASAFVSLLNVDSPATGSLQCPPLLLQHDDEDDEDDEEEDKYEDADDKECFTHMWCNRGGMSAQINNITKLTGIAQCLQINGSTIMINDHDDPHHNHQYNHDHHHDHHMRELQQPCEPLLSHAIRHNGRCY